MMMTKVDEYISYDAPCAENALRYGEIIIDEAYNTWRNTCRLRVIRYNGVLYWHKMVDGELVEFRSLR